MSQVTEGKVLDLSRLSAQIEHELKAGIMGSARCTVCLRCGALWWTPKPRNRESYVPRYCESKERKGPPLGVYVLMNDAGGKLP